MPHPIDPVPPALGVRIQALAGDRLALQINDLGGRGWPHSAVLVPVRRDAGRWRAVHDVLPAAPAGRGPRRLSWGWWSTVPRASKGPPYRIGLATADWPGAGSAVLVLLVYYQTANVGGGVPGQLLPDPQVPPPAEGAEPFFGMLAAKVRALLDTASDDALASGIVDSTQALQPPAPAAPPPASKPAYPDKPTARGMAPAAVADPAAPAAQPLHIVLASCQYPSDVFDRMPDDLRAAAGPADRSLLALARVLPQISPPPLLLMTGDQVYVDATAGLFDARLLDDRYRLAYERRGESVGLRRVQQRTGLQMHLLIDDHEIADNWDLAHPDGGLALKRGVDAYRRHQRLDDPPKDRLWRDDLVAQGIPIFLADVRTRRQGRDADTLNTQAIMGDGQWQALMHWLDAGRADPQRPRVLATSVPVLPRRLAVAHDPMAALACDAWCGYPASLHTLLAQVCDAGLQNLVVLTGGDHLPFHGSATLGRVGSPAGGPTATLHTVHAPALFAPYPFANARPADYAEAETFHFQPPGGPLYWCRVDTRFPPAGDGFAQVSLAPHAGGWAVETRFHQPQRAGG